MSRSAHLCLASLPVASATIGHESIGAATTRNGWMVSSPRRFDNSLGRSLDGSNSTFPRRYELLMSNYVGTAEFVKVNEASGSQAVAW